MTIRDMNNLSSCFGVCHYDEDNHYCAIHREDGRWTEIDTTRTSTRNPICLDWRVVDIYADNGVWIVAEP